MGTSSMRKWLAVSGLALILGTASLAYGQAGSTGAGNGGMGTGGGGAGLGGTGMGGAGMGGTGTGGSPVGTTMAPGAVEEQPMQSPEDAMLTTKVKAAIASNAQMKGSNVSVETNQGVVNLSGTVMTEAQKKEADRLAKQVKGVKSVNADNLMVSKGK